MYNKYVKFQDDIKKKYGEQSFIENDDKLRQNINNNERSILDKELHSQIRGIGMGKEIALPGNSLHEKGLAIDIGCLNVDIGDVAYRLEK